MISIGALAANAAPYKSGQISTKETFLYGKFRAKVTAPGTKGSCTGFFTQWSGPNMGPEWNSLEIEIVPSVEGTPLSLDLSYGNGVSRQEGHHTYTDFDAGSDSHIYEFTWSPNRVTFSVDDKLLKEYKKGDPYVDNANRRQNIQFNMWAPRSDAHPEADWNKGLDESTFPWYAKMDWVEYYSWDSSSDDFQLQWHDNFDWLD